MYDDDCGLPRLGGNWCGIVALDGGALSGCWPEIGRVLKLLDISSALEDERLGSRRTDARVVVHRRGCMSPARKSSHHLGNEA